LGAGAKTAVGYGAFCYEAGNTDKANREHAGRLHEQRQRHRRKGDLARLSPNEAELERRAEVQGWHSDRLVHTL